MDIKTTVSICVIISILAPIVSYVYFEKMFSSENDRLTGLIEKLNQENMNLTQRLGDAENLIKPYLVTNLGWYLHNSTDPVVDSRHNFTIYGTVTNVGLEPALDCKLIIHFYNKQTLLQTSEIDMGNIGTRNLSRDGGYFYISRTNIHCDVADSVTRIEITPKWS